MSRAVALPRGHEGWSRLRSRSAKTR
jgi:hypothetical protein